MEKSPLMELRLKYRPEVPPKNAIKIFADHAATDEIKKYFPHLSLQNNRQFEPPKSVGVVFSGGQAPGGHNVIIGLYEELKQLNPNVRLIGFKGGPSGILENKTVLLDETKLAPFRNQGGFDLIGSGRTKIETEEQFQAAAKTCQENDLDGLVIIGGDDSNTNAALLAEYFLKHQIKTSVVGVPKTIDGDLKGKGIEISFGFDTACKTYAETIGSLERDALSAKKYWFFVKIMGRSASHVALECALQTHPNITLIGEEIAAKQTTLQEVVNQIADVIVKRSDAKKNYGVAVIPEGLIEFISDFKERMEELPDSIKKQFEMDRDPHGNIQLSKIETERLLIDLVKKELEKRDKAEKFSPQPLFLGYEGRSCLPSNFDAAYCNALGIAAALLLQQKATGYMACVQNLAKPVAEWKMGGIPIISLMGFELRKGKMKPVVSKALVDLDGKAFKEFAAKREAWALNDEYRYPGPIQFSGPIADEVTHTLRVAF